MAQSFAQRMREAAKLRRSTIQDTRRQISKIYQQAAEGLARKAAAAGSALTREWADTYSKEMQKRVHEIWLQVGDLTQAGMRSAAGSAVAAQVDFLSEAAELAGLDIRSRFASTFAHTPDEALASVIQGGLYKGKGAGLSKRIWNNEALANGQIEDAITQAIAQGWSADDLAKALRGYVREDAEGGSNVFDIFNPDKASYNARRLATASINHAYWSATLMAARDNPYADFLHWELSMSGGNHCPYCIEYASHDEGLGIGNFPIEAAPLPHPWCTCTWFVDTAKSLDQVAKELGRWEQGEANPALDQAFGQWQQERGQGAHGVQPEQISGMAHFREPIASGYRFSQGSASPSQEITKIISSAISKATGDFPVFKDSPITILFGDEPGAAAAGHLGILLDTNMWRSKASILAVLQEAMETGHTKNASGPEFIIAHEIGHVLHKLLAFRQSGVQMLSSDLMRASYASAYNKIAQDAYIAAFPAADFPDIGYDQIMAAVKAEMGARAIDGPEEFIAQSVAMGYYGTGTHRIADAVLQYLIDAFRR